MQDESELRQILEQLKTNTPASVWAQVRQAASPGNRRFDQDLNAFQQCFGEDVLVSQPRAAAWTPSPEVTAHANVTDACAELGLADYDSLHRWSVASRTSYWEYVLRRLSIQLRKDPDRLLDASCPTAPVWLPGTRMNIVESCFQAGDKTPAIVASDGTGPVRTTSISALRVLVGQIGGSLTARGIQPGDRIGVILPMTPLAVAVYLGIIAAGATVVCIPESFAAPEMEVRLRTAGAILVITQDVLPRGAKLLPLYERVCAADAPSAIVIAYAGPVAVSLREGDVEWSAFLGAENTFAPVERSPQDPICILFSSGTTGDPKAIPWDHTTPIRDHEATYFAGTGIDASGWPYRRHGDELAALPNGYFQALGRCDDTMNLSGIKVGCAEIEAVVGRLDRVLETAAVAITDSTGGPSRLAIFVVLQPGADLSALDLKERMQQEIKTRLNPLFTLDEVRIVASLPRTASNKIMRRQLRQDTPD